MTRIVIPDKTPEHQACETALHVAVNRIVLLEQSIMHVFAGGIFMGLIFGAIFGAVML